MRQINTLKQKTLTVLVFFVICAYSVSNVYAQRRPNFNCRNDQVHSGVVQFSTDPSNLIIGQQTEVRVFDNRNRRLSDRGFSLTSNNRNVRINGMTFHVDNTVRGEPWLHVDGRLVEEDGEVTIRHSDCNQAYTFPFRVRQSFVFDQMIICRGERREFAIAPYRNMANRNLYVVLDITRNQLHLLEAPITIDASGIAGIPGVPGVAGAAGTAGRAGTAGNPNGGAGGPGHPGGHGGPGGDGGAGGEIIVHLVRNTPGHIIVNVNGGAAGIGGAGGAGGRGGAGGIGYSRRERTGEYTNRGRPRYRTVQVGRAGASGSAGITGQPGRAGQPGSRGTYSIIVDHNIQRHFENVRHPHFRVENIILN